MLSVSGLGCKQYREQMDSGAVPELICPDPECRGARLRGHGWYTRYLEGELQAIRRVRCSRCKVSHAVLPEDVCAYRDLRLGSVEAALAAGTPSAGAEVSGSGRQPWRAAGARLAAQWRGAVCRQAARRCWGRCRVRGGRGRRRWWARGRAG